MRTSTINPQRMRLNLRHSLIDGLLYSLMVGCGESFIAAMAISKSFSPTLSGWISTLPLLAGALFQLLAPLGVIWLGGYDRFVLVMATTQAFALLILASLATTSDLQYFTLFLVTSLYWAAGLSAGPAWNAWMHQLIPARTRTRFFSKRTSYSNLASLLGLVSAGFLLQHRTNLNLSESAAFAVLFLTAASMRLGSAYHLWRQEPAAKNSHSGEAVGIWNMGRAFRQASTRRLMLFILIFQTCTNTASSFFTPYMLKELKLDYMDYMMLLGSALISRIITVRIMGRWMDRVSITKIFALALTLTIPVPAFWALGSDYGYLVVLQIISGAGWGLYELTVFLMLFNGLPQRERAGILSFFSLLQTFGIVFGAVAGGIYLEASLANDWGGYLSLFVLSSLVRMLALLSLPKEALRHFKLREWIELRPISVRAHGGMLARPLLPRIPLRSKKSPP